MHSSSLPRELKECFDLFYYNGLANQKKPIGLTISKSQDSV